MISCMAIKTISLELDAYEKLRAAKRPGESFSQVVRRTRIEPESATGEAILARLQEWAEEGLILEEEPLAYWKKAANEDARAPRISPSPWNEPPR